MINSNPIPSAYNSTLFVGQAQHELAETLAGHLLTTSSDAQYKRSIILEGPPEGGKSWMLVKTHELIDKTRIRPITLFVTSADFRAPASHPDVLFRPILARLWRAAVEQTRGTRSMVGRRPVKVPPKTEAELAQAPLDVALYELCSTIERIKPLRYILIFFDGMEEVKELSQPVDEDLLYAFEQLFIVPLFKYQNARMLAARRANGSAQWRTFTVKPQTKIEQLKPFTAGAQQFEQWVELQNRELAAGQKITLSFDELQDQTRPYQWNNPGANHCLIRQATALNSPPRKQMLNDCIDLLLKSPGDEPMGLADKQWLLALIADAALASLDREPGEGVAKIGESLNRFTGTTVSVSLRNAFLSRMHNRGAGTLNGRFFHVPPEIVALGRALQDRQP